MEQKWNGNGMENKWITVVEVKIKWNGTEMEWKWNGEIEACNYINKWFWKWNGMELEWKWNGTFTTKKAHAKQNGKGMEI